MRYKTFLGDSFAGAISVLLSVFGHGDGYLLVRRYGLPFVGDSSVADVDVHSDRFVDHDDEGVLVAVGVLDGDEVSSLFGQLVPERIGIGFAVVNEK